MNEELRSTLSLLLLMGGAGLLAGCVSHLLRHGARWRGGPRPPQEDASLRVKSREAVYRSRFVGETAAGWRIAAPLQRDAYVPLRVGDELVVEASDAKGAMLFRSVVVERCLDDHTLVLLRPKQTYRSERRRSARESASGFVRVGSNAMSVIDRSETGLRAVGWTDASRGDRLAVRFDGEDRERIAEVVEVAPIGRGRCEVRLNFVPDPTATTGVVVPLMGR